MLGAPDVYSCSGRGRATHDACCVRANCWAAGHASRRMLLDDADVDCLQSRQMPSGCAGPIMGLPQSSHSGFRGLLLW